MYDEEIKKKAIQRVKSGESLRKTSKEMGIPLSTVAFWCKGKAKSKFKNPKKKVRDEDIIKAIRKNLALTERELEEVLGYGKNSLRVRLIKLTKSNKIDYVIIPGGGKTLLRGYIDRKIYYIKKEDLEKWLQKKLPKGIPKGLKRAITQRLRNSGIKFSFETRQKKAILLDEESYKELEQKAKEKGVSVAELVKEI